MVRKKLPRMVRIQILVEPEVAEAYKDLSNATGRSLSSLASEVLTEAMPGISKFSRIIHEMEFDPSAGFREMAEMAIVAAQEAKQFSLELGEEAKKRA